MTLQVNDLQVDTASRGAIPLRIEPAKHGGSRSQRFASVSSALTLPIATPVSRNDDLELWQSWDPNTGVDVAVNEVQELTIAAGADGGTYTLLFKGEESATIAFGANAATIETAFEALSTVGSGNGTVAGSGDVFTITFTGTLAGAGQDLVVVNTALLLDGAIQSDADVTRLTAGSGGAAVDEVQTMDDGGTASGGTFTLTFDGRETAAIAFDAIASAIETAIDLLDNVADGHISVSGGALPGTPVVFTFDGASFTGVDVPMIVADSALLTGTSPDYAVVQTTAGSSGTGAPAGQIDGFVYPSEIVLSEDGEIFATVMHKGAIHADDIPLPTTGSPTQEQLNAALRDGLLGDKGILIDGLNDVR